MAMAGDVLIGERVAPNQLASAFNRTIKLDSVLDELLTNNLAELNAAVDRSALALREFQGTSRVQSISSRKLQLASEAKHHGEDR